MGRHEEALTYAVKANTLVPLSVNFLNNLANVYIGLGRYEDAERTYRQALKINPDSRPILYEFAYMYCAKGDYAKAMDYVNEIVSNGGKWIVGRHLWGLLYSKTGKPEKAKQMLDNYLMKFEKKNKNVDHWDIATLYTFCGDHENAVKYLNEAADARIGAVVLIKFAVSFFELHNNKGFIELCNRIGLK